MQGVQRGIYVNAFKKWLEVNVELLVIQYIDWVVSELE